MEDTKTFKLKYCNTTYKVVATTKYEARDKFCTQYDISSENKDKVKMIK